MPVNMSTVSESPSMMPTTIPIGPKITPIGPAITKVVRLKRMVHQRRYRQIFSVTV